MLCEIKDCQHGGTRSSWWAMFHTLEILSGNLYGNKEQPCHCVLGPSREGSLAVERRSSQSISNSECLVHFMRKHLNA